MKTSIILALCCGLLAGCRTGDSASSQVPASPESLAKRVEQLSLQQERIEQLGARWPHNAPDILRSVQAGRVAWTDYLRSEKEQRTSFAASGIVLDGEYYRLQEQLLDAFAAQWQQVEELLAKTP